MNYLTIPSWEKHQHYSKRNPPWIKLQKEFLTDYKVALLPDNQLARLNEFNERRGLAKRLQPVRKVGVK